ncbi:YqzL family protein [Brassicibacter mesophilus]|jgi:YqzL-like protein|uniref:YqzL family protein n=1 Tax=Brassicibacter mesophilus TaxID=745119 RepID=UPI003D2576E3
MLLNEMWQIFEVTGNVDAYLYYKEIEEVVISKDIKIEGNKIREEKLLQGF